MSAPSVVIVTGHDAVPLVEYAAGELQRYLERLFGITPRIRVAENRAADSVSPASVVFILGTAAAAHVRRIDPSLPALSDQGHLLRRLDEKRLLLVGGSPAAVCWAVYELVQEFGVIHLLHGDVLPEHKMEFHLPRVERTLEPELGLRVWRQFNDLPTAPGLWTLAQQRVFIRQLFKLKYNGIYVCLWPHHPFVDYQVGGIRRRTATLLFGQQIPIDAENIGREHLPDLAILDNPELASASTYEEKLEAGRRLMDGILDAAQELGMYTAVHFQPLEFPAEFRPLLQQPTEAAIQLGGLTCAERGELTNPGHMALIEASFRAHLEQWGRVDEFHLSLPEHPQADGHYQQCWRELDARYQLEPDYPLQQVLDQGAGNYLIPGGLDRAAREVKSGISMLHFCDRLFASTDLLQRAAAQQVQVHLNVGGNSEPLFPVLERILWPGAGISTSLGYTSSRAVRALHAMDSLDAARVPATLVMTLQDDNVGSLPQVATRSIDQLLDAVQAHGWRGFLTRHWPVGDLDPLAAYVSQRSWDARVTPQAAYEIHFGRVYGAGAARQLAQFMDLLEDATVILDVDFLGLFFPVLGIVCRSLEADAPMAEGLFHLRATYEQALRLLAQVEPRVTTAAGQRELAYWRSRVEFAVQALIEKEWVHEGARRVQQARSDATTAEQAAVLLEEARVCFTRAVGAGEAALRATASQVRDETDVNTLAAYYHFFVREVRQRSAQLLAGAGGISAHADPM